MKKLLTLLLALLLTLGLTAPALAFTSDDTEDDDMPYELSIYLVEYDDNDFFGIASLPMSDRGYAKNEIVAAVVELYVPEDEAIVQPDYLELTFGGDNVDLDITDNYNNLHQISLQVSDSVTDLLAAHPGAFALNNALNSDDEIQINVGAHGFTGEETYKCLFFAKVTGDDASLTATLKDGMIPDMEFDGIESSITITLDGVIYGISKGAIPDGIRYIIGVGPGSDYLNNIILIDVDEDNVSEGMTLLTVGNHPGILGVNTDGELGVADDTHPAVLMTSGDLYDDVMDFYNDVVVDVFGLDYFKIGNYVRDSFFENLVSPRTLIATVDIEPWTAYVTVPDNIVTDPPKTGDAASIMGFAMVALAGSSAMLLKKRG